MATNRRKRVAKKTTDAGSKAKDTANFRKLAPIAKRINGALDRAKVAGQREVDLRLTAAQELAQASDFCKEHKINFKSWVEDNVTQGYEASRKLVAVGKSDNPALALEDMRAKNAAANRKARANAKARTEAPASAGRVTHAAPAKLPGPSAYVSTLDMANGLDDDQRAKLVQTLAPSVGMTAGVPVAGEKPAKAKTTAMQDAKRAAQAMTAPDRRKFFKWLAVQVEEDAKAALGVMPTEGMIKRGVAQASA